MDNSIKEIIWHQFGAAIDMLENAIATCPESQWDNGTNYWYISYHTLFFLDYYLSEDPANFAPPAPFSLSEMDPAGILPERVYQQHELLNYIAHCRNKGRELIGSLTTETARRQFSDRKKYSIPEILLYNMRHVQHHTAQLHLLLRQGIDDAPGWVSRSKVAL